MSMIGREKEQALLTQILNSKRAEFCSVVGRRRIGKTFLIRNFFESKKAIFFDTTGTKNGSLKIQIKHFCEQIGRVFLNGVLPNIPHDWDSAFKMLTDVMQQTKKPIILFLDEFPWMATKNGRLLETLDYYWNQHWSKNLRIKLIICGSSASWIVEKIIHNKGGLHNRVTHSLHLEPFTLTETKQFLEKAGFKLNAYQITQIYMVTGGVAYYLSQFSSHLSIDQNIDAIAFSKNSFFLDEFEKLFASLFDNHEVYIALLQAMALHPTGISQKELFESLKVSKGYSILSKLKSLQDCDFITSFTPLYHKEKGMYYKIIDEYVLFYFNWIAPIKKLLATKGLGSNYWEKRKKTPAWNSWAGFAFEAVCHKHSEKISEKLKISATSVPGAWRYVPSKGSADMGAQIDLLFDRDDDAITFCEIKYTQSAFVLDKSYVKQLVQKMDVFKKRTKTQKQLFWALISANGLKENLHSQMVNAVVTAEDLF